MNSSFKKSSALIVLALCTLNVYADPADQRAERAAQRQENRAEQRQERDARQAEANNQAQADADRRGSKMSPEERRALRRQINEAGRDLYTRDR